MNKPTEEQEIILDCWNQFAYAVIDERGRCFFNDGGLGALESVATYLEQHGLAKFDKRNRTRAPWRDSHKCPSCKRMISTGSWSIKGKCCYECDPKSVYYKGGK